MSTELDKSSLSQLSQITQVGMPLESEISRLHSNVNTLIEPIQNKIAAIRNDATERMRPHQEAIDQIRREAAAALQVHFDEIKAIWTSEFEKKGVEPRSQIEPLEKQAFGIVADDIKDLAEITDEDEMVIDGNLLVAMSSNIETDQFTRKFIVELLELVCVDQQGNLQNPTFSINMGSDLDAEEVNAIISITTENAGEVDFHFFKKGKGGYELADIGNEISIDLLEDDEILGENGEPIEQDEITVLRLEREDEFRTLAKHFPAIAELATLSFFLEAARRSLKSA